MISSRAPILRDLSSAENESQQKKIIEIDARPSDCIAMATQQRAPRATGKRIVRGWLNSGREDWRNDHIGGELFVRYKTLSLIVLPFNSYPTHRTSETIRKQRADPLQVSKRCAVF
jgi:hypothetical protein